MGPAQVKTRPANAFLLYRSDISKSLFKKTSEGGREISKQASEKWRNESPEVIMYYKKLAKEQREAFNQNNPVGTKPIGKRAKRANKVLDTMFKTYIREFIEGSFTELGAVHQSDNHSNLVFRPEELSYAPYVSSNENHYSSMGLGSSGMMTPISPMASFTPDMWPDLYHPAPEICSAISWCNPNLDYFLDPLLLSPPLTPQVLNTTFQISPSAQKDNLTIDTSFLNKEPSLDLRYLDCDQYQAFCLNQL